MADISVVRNDGERRYEARLNARMIGATFFQDRSGMVAFTHTEVEPEVEGKGVGSELARGALDDVRARGAKVVAECPFIKSFIERHDEYRDLLA